MGHPTIQGRGAALNPKNRFHEIEVERDEWVEAEDPAPRTRFYRDPTRTIIATNDSPDVGFEASINPYRGCETGCVYCGWGGTAILMADGSTKPLADLSVVLDAAPGVPLTFHRAFDALSDPLGAIDILAGIPQVDSILTSGGEGTPMERCAQLRTYSARAGMRLVIMAGAGVDDEAFALFAKTGCVRAIHLGRAARDGKNPEGPVSAASVRRLRDLADA